MRTILILLSAALAAAAQPKKIFPIPYTQRDLPNGLRIVTVPTDYRNIVALYIVVQVGSRNEIEPGKTGFAHFFEHMMFRGTKKYPPDKYQAIIKKAGAAQNAYTSADVTVYHVVFSKEDLEQMIEMESDRFQNLEYSQADFKTEALAVLGEYNKNSASPTSKISELLQDKAFAAHTYKHTTMGFLEDIQDMPNEYEYSRTFFNRYYRPEYTTVMVVGDVTARQVESMVEKHWGAWQRGSYKAPIPAEPRQTEAKSASIEWKSPTLPWLTIAFKTPAFSDVEKDFPALDLLSFLGFSNNSDLYQRLVIQEQKVDVLAVSNPDHVDPFLFTVYARVKKTEDMKNVEEQIWSTLAGFKDHLVPTEKLDAVKKHLRYRFALGLDNSEAIAAMLANYVGLRRTPEAVNKVYDIYEKLTPEDLREVARKYFTVSGRTTVTLTGPAK